MTYCTCCEEYVDTYDYDAPTAADFPDEDEAYWDEDEPVEVYSCGVCGNDNPYVIGTLAGDPCEGCLEDETYKLFVEEVR